MTSHNETVSRKISEAKSMTSEGNSALLTDGRRYSKLRFSEYFQLQNF